MATGQAFGFGFDTESSALATVITGTPLDAMLRHPVKWRQSLRREGLEIAPGPLFDNRDELWADITRLE